MTIVVLIVGFVALLVSTVVRAEYPWWGPRVARGIIHLESVIAPRPGQEEEWLGILAEQGVPGVLFALQLVPASVYMRVARINRKHRGKGWRTRSDLYLFSLCIPFILVVNAIGIIESITRYNFGQAASSVGLFAVAVATCWLNVRMDLRSIDVRWVQTCATTCTTSDQVDALMWTRGERVAMEIYIAAVADFNNGTSWLQAGRRIATYTTTRWLGGALYDWKAGRDERRAARGTPVA